MNIPNLLTSARWLDRRLFVFAISGVSATVIYATLAAWLIAGWGFNQALAGAIAFAIAVLVSYAGNTIFGFQQRPGLDSFRKYVTVSLLGLILSTLIMAAGDLFSVHYLVSISVVIFTVPVMSLILHFAWTYRYATGADRPSKDIDTQQPQ